MDLVNAVLRRPGRAVAFVLCTWAGAWSVYYVFQESHRCLALQKRRKRHPLRTRSHESDAEWFGQADQLERKHIPKRFGTLTFLGRYLNVTPEWREQGLWEWVWWKLVHTALYHGRFGWDGGLARDQATEEGRKRIEELLPVVPLDSNRLWSTKSDDKAGLTHVSHDGITYTCTCIIQLQGVTFLTDPVFGEQPLESVMSPKRMRPMPCAIEDLVQSGSIDFILLSHKIIPQIAPETQWIVPTGVAPLLVKSGVNPNHIHSLGWWDDRTYTCEVGVPASHEPTRVSRAVDITAVPASHWSARTLLDTNASLWNSYVVRLNDRHHLPGAFFFCGDSGYSPTLYQSIGRMYGPFDLATIPIGSYEPRWHLSLQHMDPHGSVHVAQDIGARHSFGMHWGTWSMSDLAKALEAEKLPSSFLRTVPFGETFRIPM